MTDPELKKLLEVAEKAQVTAPGSWGYDHNGYIAGVLPDDEEWGPTVAKLVGKPPFRHAEGEHIATFDPPTCVALAREVLRLRETLERALSYIDSRNGDNPIYSPVSAREVLRMALEGDK